MTKSLDNKLPGDKIQKINLYMNNNMLRIQEVDLTFLIFFSYFYFSSWFTPFILFLELGLGLEW